MVESSGMSRFIDRRSFDLVQSKLQSRQRPRQNGETSLFAGLIKCGELRASR